MKSPSAISSVIIASVMLLMAYLVLNTSWLSSSPSPKHPLVIAVSKTPLSAPFYIADEMNFFDAQCIKVQLKEVIGGKRSFEEVIHGNAMFGTSSDSVIMFKGLEHKNFVNISTFVQSDNDIKIITHPQVGIHTGADLVGKKIGIIKGTASEYFLNMYLAFENIQKAQIKLIDMTADQMPGELAAQKIDAIVTWEPFGFEAVSMLDGKAGILPSKSLYTLTFNLIMKKDVLDSHGDEARCLLQGLDKSMDFIASSPLQAQRILAQRLDLQKDFIDWIWGDYLFKLSLGQSLLMNIESQATWAINNKIFDQQDLPDYKQLMDVNTLLEVKPSAVSIGLRND